jgi:hypothetical protein
MFSVDICLCSGENCPLRENCKRYQYHLKDKLSGWENYNTHFTEVPYNSEKGDCDYLWEWPTKQ